MSIYENKPREGTEAFRVLEEVKKRKAIAEDKQVKKLITELYFGSIKNYPSLFSNDYFKSMRHQSAILSKAQNQNLKNHTNGSKEKTVIEITLRDRDYKFAIEQHSSSMPDEYCTRGLLELYMDNQRILAVKLSLDGKYSYNIEWKPFDIIAFIDGDWIEDFCVLKNAIEADKNEAAQRRAEDPMKTAELKRNFGIN